MLICVWYMWKSFLEALIFSEFFCSWRDSKWYQQATLLLIQVYNTFFNRNLINIYLDINPSTDQEESRIHSTVMLFITKAVKQMCKCGSTNEPQKNLFWMGHRARKVWRLNCFAFSLQVLLMNFNTLKLNEGIKKCDTQLQIRPLIVHFCHLEA